MKPGNLKKQKNSITVIHFTSISLYLYTVKREKFKPTNQMNHVKEQQTNKLEKN